MNYEEANDIALGRILNSEPVLKDVQSAWRVIPGMTKKTIFHAGPPIEYSRMCGPMKGACIGALLYEGLAKTKEEALEVLGRGEIHFEPNHDHQAVNGMAGLITYSMPVYVVENKTYGNLAFSQFQEGMGKTLPFGSFDESVIERLQWFERGVGPAIQKALKVSGEIPLKPIIAEALLRGDECHNRNMAATSIFFEKIARALIKTEINKKELSEILEFLATNTQSFVRLAMAACKVTLDSANGVRGSSVVTVYSRNGVEVGIKVSGTGNQWFVAPAPKIEGLFFPGFGEEDACPDLGDSAITEVGGLGAFAIAASPAIVKLVGKSVDDAISMTEEMYEIALEEHPAFRIPFLDFRGTPIGIDVLKVVETGIEPVCDTAIAHREAGHGMIGAGIVHMPMACFEQALISLNKGFRGEG
jgi:hypothetical protein